MTTEGDRAALAEEFPHWHVWRWQHLLYARRLRSSPPKVLRAAEADELRDRIRAAENGEGS
jgi:hypothetical protein